MNECEYVANNFFCIPVFCTNLGGKLPPKYLPRMQCAKSHIGPMTGLWFLPDRPLGLNTNE